VAQLLMLLRLLRLLRVVNLIMVNVWNWALCMIFWTCLIISVLIVVSNNSNNFILSWVVLM
jgi:hypothetical protein